MIRIPRRVLIAGAALAMPAVTAATWALTRHHEGGSTGADLPNAPAGGGGGGEGPAPAPSATVPATSTGTTTAPPIETAPPTHVPVTAPAPAPTHVPAPAPAPAPTHVPAPAPVPTPTHVPVSTRPPGPPVAPPATSAPSPVGLTGGGPVTYTVKSGDTLSAIGRRYGVSVDAIATANHIADPSRIRVGQVLTIPAAGASSTPPPAQAPAPKPAPATAPAPAPQPDPAPTTSGAQQKVRPGPAVFRVDTTRKIVALTFDDGPNGAYTDSILGVLARHDVKATFFVVGQNVARDGARLRKEVAAGHAIGNHSWDHSDLTRLSGSELRSQFTKTSDAIEHATGKRPDIFRAPYGARNLTVDAAGRSAGMRDVLWDVDTVDWRRPGSRAITNEAVSSARRGSIILMHDGGGDRSQTVASLDSTITQLQAKGYQFVTVPQLIASH